MAFRVRKLFGTFEKRGPGSKPLKLKGFHRLLAMMMFIPGLFSSVLNLNHTFFTQGECWAGNSSQVDFEKHGSAEGDCVEQDYNPCQSDCCVGGRNRNMVYQICKYHV